jgi:hypothetical protein
VQDIAVLLVQGLEETAPQLWIDKKR